MEYLLLYVAGGSMLYYLSAVWFTDATWSTHLYWPVSSALLLLLWLILRFDSRQKEMHRKHLPLRLRTIILSSVILYMSVILIFSAVIGVSAIITKEESADYIILIENSNVSDELTMEDMDAMDYALDYLNRYPSCKLVLAGASRFEGKDVEIDEDQVQDLMKRYFLDNGIPSERIMTEKVSDSIRRNITYSLAYILVDWYRSEDGLEADAEPRVSVISGDMSVLRYRFVLSSMNQNMGVISYREGFLTWPVRIIEEMELMLRFHLENQFIFKMGGKYGIIRF